MFDCTEDETHGVTAIFQEAYHDHRQRHHAHRATCVGEHETLAAAAQQMRDLGGGALPICGDDDRLHGIITDRDIVIKCLATGHDPSTMTTGELAQGATYHVEAGASTEQMQNVMKEH